MKKAKSKLLCRSCDLVVEVPPYRKGYRCVCPQCRSQLRSGNKVDIYNVAVVSVASIIVLLTSIFLPFMTISALGITQSMTLSSIFFILKQDWISLLYVCILFTFLCPLVMHLIVIGIVFFNLNVTKRLANLYMICHRFCMVDVFILGVLVSLIKLVALAEIHFHAGFYSAIIFALLMVWCYSRCSPYMIWNLVERYDAELKHAHIGMRGIDQRLIMCSHCGMVFKSKARRKVSALSDEKEADLEARNGYQICPRCGHHCGYRKKQCYQKTIALLLAAIILYIPSNLYPIMYTSYLGTNIGANIIDGVISIWGMKSYFVALVILLASICIPVMKILCMVLLLVVSKRGLMINPSRYNMLYRVVLFIGKWSMIDVFVVIIMSTVVRMSSLLTISPGIAIVCFCAVVIITMIAAEEFDERLLWDRMYDDLEKIKNKQDHRLNRTEVAKLILSYRKLTKKKKTSDFSLDLDGEAKPHPEKKGYANSVMGDVIDRDEGREFIKTKPKDDISRESYRIESSAILANSGHLAGFMSDVLVSDDKNHNEDFTQAQTATHNVNEKSQNNLSDSNKNKISVSSDPDHIVKQSGSNISSKSTKEKL